MAHIFIDGVPATAEDLAMPALINYGAYTSFAVEQGGVRGLDRHLQRRDGHQHQVQDPERLQPAPARLLVHGHDHQQEPGLDHGDVHHPQHGAH